MSSVWAGSGPPAGATYNFLAQPSFLTQGAGGLLKGAFTPDAGSGSATHVAISFDVPPGFTVTRPSNCTGPALTGVPGVPDPPSGYTRVTCTIGTVNAGATATQFLQFGSSQTTPRTDHTFSGFVTFDKGTGGKGGGGGSANSKGPLAAPVTVVAPGDTTRAGECDGSANTPTAVSASDPQSTSVTATSNLPCTYVFAGEFDPTSGSASTQVSFFLAAPTPSGAYATAKVIFYSLPVAFNKFKLFYDLLSATSGAFTSTTPIPPCTGSSVPPNPGICLESLTKNGQGAIAMIRFLGTGIDPRVGGG